MEKKKQEIRSLIFLFQNVYTILKMFLEYEKKNKNISKPLCLKDWK